MIIHRPSQAIATAVGVALAAAITLTGPAAAAPQQADDGPDLGVNVTVFDPSMPVSEIQATLDATHAAQVDNEMGTERFAYLFKPGTYGTAETPLQIKVGYYTEIAGLGASPTDVVINGKVEVYNRCLATGTTASRWSTSGGPSPTCRSTSTRPARTAAARRRTSGPSRRRRPCAAWPSAATPCP